MLLPCAPRLSARALEQARRPVGLRERGKVHAIAWALRCGAGAVVGDRVSVCGAGRILDERLSEVLGEPVVVGVFLGPPRANRKPVLQLLDRQGTLVGVAKVGATPLAATLVAAEAETLRRLAVLAPMGLVTPRVIDELVWNGLPVVVQSPLKIWSDGHDVQTLGLVRAVRVIAALGGMSRRRWATSEYAGSLHQRIASLPDRELRATMAELVATAMSPDDIVVLGSWHGDLTPWNMAGSRSGTMVWDWERFETGVPFGFDLLHHHFVPSLGRLGEDVARAGVLLVERSTELLGPLGADLGSAAAVAVLYLVEIALRFTVDGQGATGVPGGNPATWLGPLHDHWQNG
ncbi:hypothetical protein ASG78_02875 [Nostocoides sp. Soil756]|jgi:hypothetical protein|nr:hypothetical protein ASG78_02875 [Tetrasphaera sp. Soil756]